MGDKAFVNAYSTVRLAPYLDIWLTVSDVYIFVYYRSASLWSEKDTL